MEVRLIWTFLLKIMIIRCASNVKYHLILKSCKCVEEYMEFVVSKPGLELIVKLREKMGGGEHFGAVKLQDLLFRHL